MASVTREITVTGSSADTYIPNYIELCVSNELNRERDIWISW
jgi:hypothetical protein